MRGEILGRPCAFDLGGQPESGELQRGKVEYQGPLKDPTKRPAEEAVRPPPELDIQADSEERWEIREEELTPEHIRRLGRYLYVSMFYVRSPAVTNDLYRAHDQAKARGDFGWMSEEEPLEWPAEAFVESFAAHYGMSVPMLRRFCDAASHEIAQLMLQTLRERRSGASQHWSDKLIELHERFDEHEGEATSTERLDSVIAMVEKIARDGLQGTINDHTTMLRKAATYAIELGVSPPSSTTAS